MLFYFHLCKDNNIKNTNNLLTTNIWDTRALFQTKKKEEKKHEQSYENQRVIINRKKTIMFVLLGTGNVSEKNNTIIPTICSWPIYAVLQGTRIIKEPFVQSCNFSYKFDCVCPQFFIWFQISKSIVLKHIADGKI